MSRAYEKKYSAVVFDCDGVIFDSNGLKTQAFRKVLSSYPNDVVDLFNIISYMVAFPATLSLGFFILIS